MIWIFKMKHKLSLGSDEDLSEVAVLLLSPANPHQVVQQIRHNLLSHHGVLLVEFVLQNVLPHPLRQGEPLPFNLIADEIFNIPQDRKNFFEGLLFVGTVSIGVFQHFPDKFEHSRELMLLASKEDLSQVQLSYNGHSVIEDISSKEELLIQN